MSQVSATPQWASSVIGAIAAFTRMLTLTICCQTGRVRVMISGSPGLTAHSSGSLSHSLVQASTGLEVPTTGAGSEDRGSAATICALAAIAPVRQPASAANAMTCRSVFVTVPSQSERHCARDRLAGAEPNADNLMDRVLPGVLRF